MTSQSILLIFTFYLLLHTTVHRQNFIKSTDEKPANYFTFTSQSDIYLAFNKQYKSNRLSNNQLLLAESIIKKVSDSLNFFITSTNVNTGKVDTLKHVFQIVSAKITVDKIFYGLMQFVVPIENGVKDYCFLRTEAVVITTSR